jgi:tetrahydromethanopterin S-methyltransferase subunit B
MSATVVQQALRTQLEEKLDSGREADEIVEKVRQSLDYIKQLEPVTRDIVRKCYQQATNAAFGVGIGIMCLSLIAATFIREKKLSK